MGRVQVPCLTVACVNAGNFAGRGAEYVHSLFAGVSRNLTVDWRGVCLTDDPSSVPHGIEPRALPGDTYGWWNKLFLFKPGMFPRSERVLYFDLDTVITGSLDDIAGYRGDFAAMSNINGPGCASGVMAWRAGRMDHVYETWERYWRPVPPSGDQEWIDMVQPEFDRLQDAYPGQLVSYKAHAQGLDVPPENARVVYFHGRPRPHQAVEPWVRRAWFV